jgi:radical SAM superfamily enzyme YgiQ (UPF0313 family)
MPSFLKRKFDIFARKSIHFSNPMKIGLIYPSRSRKRTYTSSYPPLQLFFDTNPYVPSFFLPSLSLLTIAACTPEEHELRLIDERIEPIDFDAPFDLVGISIMTEQARRGYEIAEEFRKRGVFTAIGGIHASILADEAKKHCDSVVVGEGESSWPLVLEDFAKRAVRPLYRSPEPFDLSLSPVPRYDLVDPDSYPFFPVQTTRGCPLDCSFCSATKVFGPVYRLKSIDHILAELDALLRISLNRKIVFNDDNMFLNRARSRELFKAITPLRIKYFAESDVSIADDESLLRLMAQSGCVTVFVGFESLAAGNLNAIQPKKWKLRFLENYGAACAKIQAHGIQVVGAFILGFDLDGPDVFERTADFVLKNHIFGQFHILTPFPGTRIRDELIAQGRLPNDNDDWDLYSNFDPIYAPKCIKKEELANGLLHIYRSAYTKEAYEKRSRHMIQMFKNRRLRSNGNLPSL